MNNVFNDLTHTSEESRNKALELDIKIPETFILSISVIIVYLSNIADKNPLYTCSVILFFIAIFLSLLSLWKTRELHADVYFRARNSLSQLKIITKRSFKKPEEVEKRKLELDRLLKKYAPLEKYGLKKTITSLQRITFILFFFGLIFLSLQPFWTKIISFLSYFSCN